LSYSKAVTGWRRLAAISIAFFGLAAGPAAAAGTTGLVTTSTTSSTTSTSTTSKSSTLKTKTSKSSNAAFGTRMLRVGMSGSDVLALQHDLTALSFKTTATGYFNAQTRRELKAFQQRYRLVVDGIAGPTSISTLKRLLSSKLHIAENALAAKELATGVATTATTESDAPLPAGDSGTGGVGLGPVGVNQPEQNANLIDGLAVPAAGTPTRIVDMLDAANRIAFDPYIYGGGHQSFVSRGYDCSGSVSYVLHAGSLLASPLDSEQFLKYGLSGTGNWVTIYTNGPTHAYMEIAGLWFDTAAQSATNGNDRWSLTRIAEPGYGKFLARHPAGL
jgi:peptidoglycan hydrolase-like protein with peptidoglycan-binding domain